MEFYAVVALLTTIYNRNVVCIKQKTIIAQRMHRHIDAPKEFAQGSETDLS